MTEKVSKKSGKSDKDGESKREKRKRKRETAEEITNRTVNDAEENLQEPQQKKRRNKTGFPDPIYDTAISEQASKALSYAFTQFRKPSEWKFSKARQNWLIRNIWSNAIPDAYVSLTIQYLSNVQGGVRETLIKDCQNILSVPPTPPESTPSEATSQASPAAVSASSETASKTDELKLARARVLLDALGTPESLPPK